MSTSWCGNTCVMPPKCSHKERRRGFSNRSSVDAVLWCHGEAVFLGESKSTLFDLPKVDAFRNHWLRFVFDTTAQPKCSNLCNAFYGWQFREPSRLQDWLHEGYLKKKRVNSNFAITIWCFWINDYKYVLLLVQVFAIDFKCGVLCVTRRACVCVCVRGTGSHHSGVYSPSEIILTAACVLQIHTSIITMSVTRLCSPFGLELIKLTRKLKLAFMVRVVTFLTRACGVRPITMYSVSWPIRADCACRKEGLV